MPYVLSVRGRITLFILLPLLLVATVVGLWSYKDTKSSAQSRFDESLLATASAIARDIAASGGDALSLDTRDLIADTSGGQVFYHVYAPDGVFVTGYATPPVLAGASVSEDMRFYDAQYLNSPVRVLKLQNVMQIEGLQGAFNFTVWQNTAVRDQYVRDLTRQTFIVISTITSSVALIVWFGVGIGLRPLLDLQDAIALRNTSELTPIRRAVPKEVKGVVATLNSLLAQVNESMQAKNVFISNAAHQLRNPMAGIMAMAEAVRSAPTAEAAIERTADLYESAQHASDLANKLISFERANRAGSADVFERIDVLPIIEAALKNTRQRLSAHISFNFSPALPDVYVRGDELMLEEAFGNIIDNAVKHGGPELSQIDIDVFVIDSMARIVIRDDGVGITEAELAIALERFGQVNPGSGSGLGLSIVQSVVAAHRGEFTIEPNPDQSNGVSIVMHLPLAGEGPEFS